MTRRLAALLSVVLLVATACGSSGVPGAGIEPAIAHVPRASVSPGDAIPAAQAIDVFGFDLYREVVSAAGEGTAPQDGNVVVSPASVALALAMAQAGAAGATADQMDAVLHGAGSTAGGTGLAALDLALTDRSGTFTDPEGHALPVTLRIANAPFAQRGMTIEPRYLDALASRFAAGLRLVDYRADPEAARRLIDEWVKEQTNGRIPQLLGPGALDTLTCLTLVNAIYLKAPWATPFDASATAPQPFTLPDGTSVSVPTMHRLDEYGYASWAGWQAVELPFLGGSLALDVVLPDSLSDFRAQLDGALFTRIVGALEERSVDLYLPRFGIQTRADLSRALAALGMPLAFDPQGADFSGITRDEQLYVSQVVHQADIDVDESGTEASAATAVVMAASAMPAEPVTLRLDRPFLFALRDVPTGAILFLGQVVDPISKT